MNKIQYAFHAWLNGYKKIFCYSGRERRSAFGSFMLIQCLLFILIAIIFGRLLRSSDSISEFVIFTYFFVHLLAAIPYNVRRLHDANISGWVCLLYFGFMGIVVIVSIFLPATVGDNKYGPNPKELEKQQPNKTNNLIIN